MKVFFDTNIIMDYLAVRHPFFYDASILVDMCDRKEIQGVISSLTVINCAYLLRKAFSKELMLDKVKWMVSAFEISSINKQMLEMATLSNPHDFEDEVQIHSAMSKHVDVLITRDGKGFDPSKVIVQTPAEFIANCMKS